MATVIGIDIGATKTLGVALGGDGTVVAQVRLATEAGPEGVLRTASRVVAELAGSVGPDAVVGVGVPGVVDPVLGEVSHAVNLGIDGLPLPLAGTARRPGRAPGPGRERRQRRRPRRRRPHRLARTLPTSGSAPGSPLASSSTAGCVVAPAVSPARSGTSRSNRTDWSAGAASAAAWRPSHRARRSPSRGRRTSPSSPGPCLPPSPTATRERPGSGTTSPTDWRRQ